MFIALPIVAGFFLNFTKPNYHFVRTTHKVVVTTTAPSSVPPPPPPVVQVVTQPSTPATTVQEFLMQAINSYRRGQGLTDVKTDPNTCSFAKIRAQEISQNFNHDGFNSRVQNHSLSYPSYRLVTENIAMNSNYKNVVTAWINSPGHAENMRADTPYVCVEATGNYYAYEGWKP